MVTRLVQPIIKAVTKETKEELIESGAKGAVDEVAEIANKTPKKEELEKKVEQATQELDQEKSVDPTQTDNTVTFDEQEQIKASLKEPDAPTEPPMGGETPPPPPPKPEKTTFQILREAEQEIKATDPDRFLYTDQNLSKYVDSMSDEEFFEAVVLPEKNLDELLGILKDAGIATGKLDALPDAAKRNMVAKLVPKVNLDNIKSLDDLTKYDQYVLKIVNDQMKKNKIALPKSSYTLPELAANANEIPKKMSTQALKEKPMGIGYINSADLIRHRVVKLQFKKQLLIESAKLTRYGDLLDPAIRKAKKKDLTPEQAEIQYTKQKMRVKKAKLIVARIIENIDFADSEVGRQLGLMSKFDKLDPMLDDKTILTLMRQDLDDENVEQFARMVVSLNGTKNGDEALENFIAKSVKKGGRWLGKDFVGLYVQSLLGSVQMHINNFVENISNSQFLFLFNRIPSALVGNTKEAYKRSFKKYPVSRNKQFKPGDFAQFRDISLMAWTDWVSITQGLRNSWRSLRTYTPIDPLTKIWQKEREIWKPNRDPEYLASLKKNPGRWNMRKIQQKLETVMYHAVNMGGRLLTSADEFFGTKIYNRNIVLQVSRQIDNILETTGDVDAAKEYAVKVLKDPPEEMVRKALADKRETLYQAEEITDPDIQEKLLNDIISISNSPGFKLGIPFNKIYFNLQGQLARYTPGQPLVGSGRRALKEGGMAQDVELGKVLLGTTIITSAAAGAGGVFREDKDCVVVGHYPVFWGTGIDSESRREIIANFKSIGLDQELTAYCREPGAKDWRNPTHKISLRKAGLAGALYAIGADYNMAMHYSKDINALTNLLMAMSFAVKEAITDIPHFEKLGEIMDLTYIRNAKTWGDKFDALAGTAIDYTADPVLDVIAMRGTGGIMNPGLWSSVDRMWEAVQNEGGPRDYTPGSFEEFDIGKEDVATAWRRTMTEVTYTWDLLPGVGNDRTPRDRFGRPYDPKNTTDLQWQYTNRADIGPDDDPVSQKMFEDNIAVYYQPPFDMKGVKLTNYERNNYHYMFTTQPLELTYPGTNRPLFPGKGAMTWYDSLHELFYGDSGISQIYKRIPTQTLREEYSGKSEISKNTVVRKFLEEQFASAVEANMLESNESLSSRIAAAK